MHSLINDLARWAAGEIYFRMEDTLKDCRRLKKLCNDMGNLTKLHHLRNSNVHSLEEMPKGFGKLTCLLTLGRFVVGKVSGSGLRELKSLTHLQETLRISKLENVKDVCDACEAQLNNKVNLKALLLEWSIWHVRNLDQCEFETRVLSMLKPHQDVQELTITGYEWEEWIHFGSGQEVDEVFPKLRKLSLFSCSKLQGALPKRLLLLEKLVIQSCKQLLVTIQCLPALSELQIKGCKRVVLSSPMDLSSLKSVLLGEMANEVISGCPQLLSLVTEDDLELSNCKGLTKLPQALLTLSSLRELRISGCASLVSFPQAALPSQLRTFKIEHCNALESLPEAWMRNSNSSLQSLEIGIQLPPSLRRLIISDCYNLRTLTGDQGICSSRSGRTSLTSFSSENELPATLEQLEVRFCSNLAFLSRNGNLPQALTYLEVSYCSKLESLAERLDNTSLEVIAISYLENLKSLPAGLHNLHHLQELKVYGCPNLESFPEGGLPSTKLTKLTIGYCENLKALPNCMHNLTSLLHLEIGWCRSLVSFPEDGFPTNLESLEVHDLKISKPLFEWGLNKFSSLRELQITGGCPDLLSSPWFPASLTVLHISYMPNLESLSLIVENLTSLEILILCKCPKLDYFPEQRLPKSLLQLTINGCPLIEKRWRKDKRKYWPMITHIPCVKINNRLVFEEDGSSICSRSFKFRLVLYCRDLRTTAT
ncbi:hypothetical protein CUMW_206010, partial [Citrus unshiu]